MGYDYESKITKYVKERDNYGAISSKKRLKGQISTKMRTLMIGSIAQIEKYLGEGWGHGLTDNNCTDDQLDKRAIWKMLRDSILDFGNAKIREMEKELDKYQIESNNLRG